MAEENISLRELIQKADAGDLDAMFQVGHYLFFEDYDPSIDPAWFQRGLDYLKKASEAGNTDAMIDCGAVYYNGYFVKQDFDTAVYWYKKAADAGNVQAISNMYYYGRGPLKIDYEKAYIYFTKAAMLGDDVAWYKVGDFYLKGIYVSKDPTAAFSFYLRCRDILEDEGRPLYGWPDVCSRLGTCLHRGLGTEKNLMDARTYLQMAVTGFKQRKEDGDRFTDNVLARASEELEKVEKEMAADA